MPDSPQHTTAMLLWGSGPSPTEAFAMTTEATRGQAFAVGQPHAVLDTTLRPASDWVAAASFPSEADARLWWQNWPRRADVDESAIIQLDHTERSDQINLPQHAYVIIAVVVNDFETFATYGAALADVVHRNGGSLFGTGLGASALPGTSAPPVVAIMRWPSIDAATDFYDCADYRPHRDTRRSCSDASIVAITSHSSDPRRS